MGQWWIATDILARGGHKVAGPFGEQMQAIEARQAIEKIAPGPRLWVDEEDVPAKAAASPEMRQG